MSDPVSADRPITDFERRFGHPPGLFVLFFAEMWERFSYYGMRGILIFYLTQHLLFDDSTAGAQYGSYTSLVYLLPLGGLLTAILSIGLTLFLLYKWSSVDNIWPHAVLLAVVAGILQSFARFLLLMMFQ